MCMNESSARVQVTEIITGADPGDKSNNRGCSRCRVKPSVSSWPGDETGKERGHFWCQRFGGNARLPSDDNPDDKTKCPNERPTGM